MINWIIVLAATALIFLVVAWTLANRCISMYEEIKKLERNNASLKYSIRALKAENDKLRCQVACNPDVEKVTALKLSLYLKQEKIDALQAKVNRQQQLLQQKWEGAKKCG